MTEQPPPGGYPPPPGQGYPPPPPPGSYPPPGGYPPPPAGYYPPPGYPTQIPALPKQAYTSWGDRVLASLIDGLPVLLLSGIGQGVMIATADNNCVRNSAGSSIDLVCTSEPTGLGLTVALVMGLAAAVFAIWNYGYRQGTTGSSIGKSVRRFKVVSERTGAPIGFGMSVVRQLAHFVDSLLCYVGYLWPLWDSKRQTFADKLLSTVCLPTHPVHPGVS